MPVKKADGAILRKTGVDYEIVPRKTVQSINNTDALAVWVYLLTKPANWVVRRTEIRAHFSLSKERTASAIRYLVEDGLLTVCQSHDGGGKFEGSLIWVHSDRDSNHRSTENRSPVNRIHKDTEKDLKDAEIKPLRIPFEDFYSNYPKKTDRVRCEMKWRRLSLSDQKKAIAGIAGFTYGKEKQFINAPTVYLNGKRWEDENDTGSTVNGTEGWE